VKSYDPVSSFDEAAAERARPDGSNRRTAFEGSLRQLGAGAVRCGQWGARLGIRVL